MKGVTRKEKVQRDIREEYALAARAEHLRLLGDARRHQRRADALVQDILRGAWR